MAVVYIVILIGVLVFIHEFGHYLAARLFNVKVLSFSIGFGPKLFKFGRGETSWEVRLLPLGGYVMMFGSDFEEVTDKSDPDFERAYNNKKIWQKAIINLAGPLFNLIFPIPILFACYTATVTEDMPANVGQVLDNSPAVGLLQPGDVIVDIDGTPTKYWTQMRDIVSDNPGKTMAFTVLRDGQEQTFDMTIDETVLRDAMDVMTETVGRIGITPDMAPPVIGVTSPQSPAGLGGLKTFDEITVINGQNIHSYIDIEHAIAHQNGDTLKVSVLRPVLLDVPYGSVSVLTPIELEIKGKFDSAKSFGIASDNMFLSEIDDDSPAARAGLRPGDQILAMDGESVNIFRSFLDKLRQSWDQPHQLTVQRNGEIFNTNIQLEKLTITGEFQEEVPVIYAGIYHRSRYVMPDTLPKTMAERIGFAAEKSVETTWKASTMLVVYVGRMFQGRVSTKSLGGPIMIGHMASKAGDNGLIAFLQMMAVISINLGILNLLPIPLFDGGKLAILGVEAVKRGPLSMKTRQIIAYVGLVLVALLIMLAFKNDLERMWNLFFS